MQSTLRALAGAHYAMYKQGGSRASPRQNPLARNLSRLGLMSNHMKNLSANTQLATLKRQFKRNPEIAL